MEKHPRSKVFVGMSGGVDSSVSALLLRDAGYDVVGVFIKVWQADFLPCSWRDERRDAMRAAAHLSIPFLTLDLEKEYKEEVVDYMISEYSRGRIPNPDVMCNKYVKFGAFLEFARSHGADYVATGHYAQIDEHRGKPRLLKGVDTEKDQSYFLWTLSEEVLASVLFPIGHLKKNEVRSIAKEKGLPNAEKKDSQGLCFMGPIDMEDFLKHYIKTEKGKVFDTEGKEIGEHHGATLYTIGQRHGFRVTSVSPNDRPYFVIAKDISANTITVSHNDASRGQEGTKQFKLDDVTQRGLVGAGPHKLDVRIRYRGELINAILAEEQGTWKVTMESPISDIADGQSAVFYRDGVCIGGGIISHE
jgi:tRNA-specific 2-thiouridylase